MFHIGLGLLSTLLALSFGLGCLSYEPLMKLLARLQARRAMHHRHVR